MTADQRPDRSAAEPRVPPAAVIVLAAGGGTRMKSAMPKVLHTIGGRSLIDHVLRAARALRPDHLVTVVGHGRDQVAQHVVEMDAMVTVVVQEEQHGTGHAVQTALASIPDVRGTVVVTYADVPLQTAQTLGRLVTAHGQADNAVTVLTAELDDPVGYGRLIRDSAGQVVSIVEEKDASVEQRAITETNSGISAYDADFLRAALTQVGSTNAAGEIYLTDVVAIARRAGRGVGAIDVGDSWQTEGVNTRSQLSRLGAELNRRTLEHWMREGVEVIDPATTWVDVDVRLGHDVSLRPGVQLHGQTTIDSGAVIGPDSTLADVEVGRRASVIRTHATSAVIGADATVGPFAYLRPGTRLGQAGKIGAFVETKNAVIADGAKVPHLSYVGDAEIGAGTNIGAGTIFANYDGVSKHRTTVGAHCRTGSNNTFVAPVQIADGSATGAGTVVRRDVPPGALAVSTGPQRHIADWVQRKRPGTPAARAAEQSRQHLERAPQEEAGQ
ncbi:MAG: bifunctional UDP-N-acetylglucosamine diphosphorylase/glucosamine-1-phosphate N-acetyltransferase GlmU [Nocardioidaceae bacterium]